MKGRERIDTHKHTQQLFGEWKRRWRGAKLAVWKGVKEMVVGRSKRMAN